LLATLPAHTSAVHLKDVEKQDKHTTLRHSLQNAHSSSRNLQANSSTPSSTPLAMNVTASATASPAITPSSSVSPAVLPGSPSNPIVVSLGTVVSGVLTQAGAVYYKVDVPTTFSRFHLTLMPTFGNPDIFCNTKVCYRSYFSFYLFSH
jgi:hypothetical protein